jgi:hypothetical protein
MIDITMRHKNANPRKIPPTMAFTSDIGGTAKTTTPKTKKHAPMIPRIGPRMHTERDAGAALVCIRIDSCTYIHLIVKSHTYKINRIKDVYSHDIT